MGAGVKEAAENFSRPDKCPPVALAIDCTQFILSWTGNYPPTVAPLYTVDRNAIPMRFIRSN